MGILDDINKGIDEAAPEGVEGQEGSRGADQGSEDVTGEEKKKAGKYHPDFVKYANGE